MPQLLKQGQSPFWMKLGVNFLRLFHHLVSPLEMRKYAPCHLRGILEGQKFQATCITQVFEQIYNRLTKIEFSLTNPPPQKDQAKYLTIFAKKSD